MSAKKSKLIAAKALQPIKRVRRQSAEIWQLFPDDFNLGVRTPAVRGYIEILADLRMNKGLPEQTLAEVLPRAIDLVKQARRTEMLKHARIARKAISSGKPAVQLTAFKGLPAEMFRTMSPRQKRETKEFDPADPTFLAWGAQQDRKAAREGKQYRRYDDLVHEYVTKGISQKDLELPPIGYRA